MSVLSLSFEYRELTERVIPATVRCLCELSISWKGCSSKVSLAQKPEYFHDSYSASSSDVNHRETTTKLDTHSFTGNALALARTQAHSAEPAG